MTVRTPGRSLGNGDDYYNRGPIKTGPATDSTVLIGSPNNVSCHRSSASENGIGIRKLLDPLSRSSTIPRTPEGAPDVDEMLRRVRAGWPGSEGSPWALPSTGSPGPRCGIHLGTAQECLGCKHRWAVMTSCRGWPCSGCAPKRVRQQAMATAIRVAAVLDSLVLAGGDGLAIRRAVISPPQDRAQAVFDYDNGFMAMAGVHYRKDPPRRRRPGLRSRAVDVALAHGFMGGVVVFHPWRDRQTWRFNVRGPHFHVIGPARWLAEGDGEGGWLFKSTTARMRTGAVYDRLAYDLTHVGVVPSKPVLSYFGVVSPTYRKGTLLDERIKARIKALEEHRTHVCPLCSSIDTRSIMATLEELERWGVIRPLERHWRQGPPDPPRQAVLECADCGGVTGV